MIIHHISLYSILAPLILGAFCFIKLKLPLKLLFAFIVITTIFEVIVTAYNYSGMNNLFLFHIYAYVEFLSITAILYLLYDTSILKRILLFAVVIFLLSSMISLYYFESLSKFNSIQKILESTIIVILLLIYFYQLVTDRKLAFLEFHPYFILASSFLIYFLGTALIFFFINRFVVLGNNNDFWKIHSTLNIILNLSLTIVLWRAAKYQKYL